MGKKPAQGILALSDWMQAWEIILLETMSKQECVNAKLHFKRANVNNSRSTYKDTPEAHITWRLHHNVYENLVDVKGESGRDTYRDEAIGYVQLKRERDICFVKARITPEHRVKSKQHHGSFECDEKEEKAAKLEWSGCAAQGEGRCKQDFLMEARQTQGISTPNGWTSGEVFLNWMHFFVEQVRLTSDKKVLLLLDNYESHKYCPALEYATKNNVVILSLAPHLTHEMQPMDVAVYGPLKTHFEREVNIFQKSHPGRIINQYDVARLLAPAFIKTAVAIIAVHVFERPGIWPINNHAFGDEHFAPAEVLSGRSQSQHDVNMYAADRPCTPMGSDTKKETHDNYAPNASPGPGCSKTYYSFSVLRPMPQPARPTTCKRKLQRYNILTSSTVKEEQKQKFEKGKKPVLKSLDDVSTNASQKTVKKKRRKQ
ncbi:unnamed protein product [Acanthoscelides obtectus]|uniref:DDE-1 domain-containing protein n=1 Tax=Acanthoscelides obtectus TaxID=200917 RepID=A0A9P0LYR6_ACAOB|nr:unnamed protein product [Acanthoscelides obtectus]CAK1685287.1 hypothetical protein AOBTE_LOCUS35306 [Acanthoscelides obtectus]